MDTFVTSLNNLPIVVVAAHTVGLLPQSQPEEEFKKLPTVLKNLNDLVGIVYSHEINNYLRQTSDYSVYKFTYNMKFADWKTKHHFDVMEPLIGTTREYSKHDEVDRVLRMLAGIQRFTHEITQMTIKTLPLITPTTTAAEMEQFYVIFQQLDDHYWNQAENGRSVPIDVNFAGSWPFKKATLSDKVVAYGNKDDQQLAKIKGKKGKDKRKGKGGGNTKTTLSASKHQATLPECWNCGEPDHSFYDCPDKGDPVKQAQKKLKNALKKRDSLALLAHAPDDSSDIDDDDDDETSPIVSTVAMDDSTKKKQKKGRFPNSKQVSVNVTDIIDRYHSNLSMPRDSVHPLTIPRLSANVFKSSTHSSDCPADPLSSEYDKDLPVNQQTQELFMDSGSAYHMMHTAHPLMTDMVTSTKHAVFGNDMHLPIAMEASLGELSRIQLCKGMSKQLLSVPQLCVVNGMTSIFTEAGCYTMKRGFKIRMDSDDIAFFSPLQNGLYVTSLSDLFIGMGMVDDSSDK
jgi:hypothetical protein